MPTQMTAYMTSQLLWQLGCIKCWPFSSSCDNFMPPELQ